MPNRAGAVSIATLAIVLSGCATAAPAAPPNASSAPSAAPSCVVGVAWDDESDGRTATFDEPAIKKAVSDAGANYLANDAEASVAKQATNIDSLVAQGADVLIVLAGFGDGLMPSVASAIQARHPRDRV